MIRRTPNDETLRCKLARCLMLQGKSDEAERELKAVLVLNEAHYDAQLLLARIYRSQNRIHELIDALEQAVAGDELENFADFSALLQLLMVYIQGENTEGATETAQRLLAVIPEERCGQAVDAIIQTVEIFFREDYFLWARQLLLHMQELPLAENDLHRQTLEQLTRRAELLQEALQMESDNFLYGALQDCFRTVYRDKSSDSIRESRMSVALASLQRDLESNPRQLLKQLAYLRREYPLISVDQEVFLGILCQRALDRQASLEAQAVQRATQVLPAPPLVIPRDEARRGGLFGRLMGAR